MNGAITGINLGIWISVFLLVCVPGILFVIRHVRISAKKLSRALAIFAVSFPVVMALLLLMASRAFYALTCKEGVVELFTLPFLLMATAVFLDGTLKGRINKWGWAWTALGLLLFLEEVDYGQHVLGFTPPEAVQQVTGSELNFHNLPIASVLFFVFVLSVFGLLPLAARLKYFRPWIQRLGLVPPSTWLAAGVLVIVFVINPISMVAGVDRNLQEASELGLAVILMALALEQRLA